MSSLKPLQVATSLLTTWGQHITRKFKHQHQCIKELEREEQANLATGGAHSPNLG